MMLARWSKASAASALGGALGHIPIEPGGLPCACGSRGCLEAYASSTALLAYAGPARFDSVQALIAAAGRGHDDAARAVQTYSANLGRGLAALIQIFDPEIVVLGGGLVTSHPGLCDMVRAEALSRVFAPEKRQLRIAASTLGYEAGVIGAAALALDLAKENSK